MMFRFGLTEVENASERRAGFFQGAGTAGAEVIIALALSIIFVPVILFFEVFAIVKLWPTGDEIIGFAFFAITLVISAVLGITWFILWLKKQGITLTAMRNAAKVVHSSDQGALFEHEGAIHGYGLVPYIQPGAEMAEQEEEDSTPKTFRELVKEGWAAPGADLVFGFDEEGDPLGMPKVRSLGISGKQGSGKTNTTMAVILATIAKYNGRCKLLVCDPHMEVAGDEALWAKLSPLSPFLLTIDDIRATVPMSDHDYHVILNRHESIVNPTMGGEELISWMDIVNTEMNRRLHGKSGEAWIIVMDEFAAIMGSEAKEPVARMLKEINRQARKMDMFAFLCSQEWLAEGVGGSALRNSIAAFAVHNTAESVAELIIPAQYARIAPTLEVGQLLFSSMGKTVTGRSVLVEDGDAENFVALYGPTHAPFIREVTHHATSHRALPEATGTPKTKGGLQPTEATPFAGSDAPTEEMLPLRVFPEWPAVPPSNSLSGLPMDWTTEEVEQIRALIVGRLEDADIAKKVYNVKAGPELAAKKIRVGDIKRWLVAR